MDKHSSLLRTSVNYERKKFFNISPLSRSAADKEVKELYFFSLQDFLLALGCFVRVTFIQLPKRSPHLIHLT